jgi:hypothetical protein
MEKAGAFVVFHDDGNGDEQMKFIGIFTTKQSAEAAVDGLSKMPGFADYPLGFSVEFHPFDRIGWPEGFVRMPNGND